MTIETGFDLFNLSEELYATISYCKAYLWDGNNQCIQTLTGNNVAIDKIKFLPKSKRILPPSEDGFYKFWFLRNDFLISGIFAPFTESEMAAYKKISN